MKLRPLAGKIKRKLKPPQYHPPKKSGDKYKILGKWMYLDDKDSMRLAKFGIYNFEETKLIKKLVKRKHIVLDIGANIGYFTLLMAKQAKLVHAFEPEAQNFQLLKKNVELNKISNVKLHNVAVAEKNGKTKLHLCETNRGMHRIYPSRWCTEGSNEVKTVRMDDVIQEADFIKIDVEGAELGALKGMAKLLKKCEVTILMEFHPPSIIEYGSKPREIFDLVTSLDYNFKLPLIIESLSFEQIEQRAMEHAGTNIICTPIAPKKKSETLIFKYIGQKLFPQMLLNRGP
jgi:FkbM family methyltransferase